ncbi:hypothetical protein LXL04_017212 [Taraxacum kok-saghyz]
MKCDSNSLWKSTISGLHNLGGKAIPRMAKKTLPGVWYNNMKCFDVLQETGIEVDSVFKLQIGDGQKALFWRDNWTGLGPLQSRYPRLFQLDKKKSAVVADRFRGDAVQWAWNKKPSSGLEVRDLAVIEAEVAGTALSNPEDSWISLIAGDGRYQVSDIRGLLDSVMTESMQNPIVWIRLVPTKVMCFMWRAVIGRIPVALALSRRGIAVNSPLCHLCSGREEDADHLFTSCPFAMEVLSWLLKWCNIPHTQFSKVEEMVSFAADWGCCLIHILSFNYTNQYLINK